MKGLPLPCVLANPKFKNTNVAQVTMHFAILHNLLNDAGAKSML
jgi:hypothetical protein